MLYIKISWNEFLNYKIGGNYMFKVLEYVAIVSAIIGVIYLSLFCESIIYDKKEKT